MNSKLFDQKKIIFFYYGIIIWRKKKNCAESALKVL